MSNNDLIFLSGLIGLCVGAWFGWKAAFAWMEDEINKCYETIERIDKQVKDKQENKNE